jgi:hypothetical protein
MLVEARIDQKNAQGDDSHHSFSYRGVVQLARMHGWGPCGRWFESSRPDHYRCLVDVKNFLLSLYESRGIAKL